MQTGGTKGSSEAGTTKGFVAGRFAVQRILGEGGEKVVYLAHDTVFQRDPNAGSEKLKQAIAVYRRIGAGPPWIARIAKEQAGGSIDQALAV